MQFAEEMAYCNEHGIPHSRFLEEWDFVDRAKAVAFQRHQGSICGRCNTALWEWDPEQGGSKFAYEPVEEICPGCQMKDYVQQDAKPHPGRYVVLRPTSD